MKINKSKEKAFVNIYKLFISKNLHIYMFMFILLKFVSLYFIPALTSK